MFEKMRKIIAEHLNVDEAIITKETSFKDELNVDSLDLYQLVMGIEEEYDIEIPPETLEKLKTVGDVYNYLKEIGLDSE